MSEQTAARPRKVSAHDRSAFARQVATLQQFENDDQGTAEWRSGVIARANAWRATHGIDPLVEDWWNHQPELDLYRRARTLGLLRTVR